MSEQKRDCSRKVNSFGRTESKVIKFTYKWEICNYSHCIQQNTLLSPKFSIDGYDGGPWYIQLKHDDDDIITLILFTDDKSKPYFVKYNFCIPDSTYESFFSSYDSTTMYTFADSFQEWFIKPSTLKEEPELLPNDTRTILCDIDLIKIVTSESLEWQKITGGITNDLKHLFQSKKFTDITLTVGKKNFEAHKTILVARSSVFAAMFDNEMKENKENKVNITDITAEAFEELLRYIYTEEAPNLETMTADLLAAADKYELLRLKAMCEKSLHEGLNVGNAAEILVIADRHNAHQLKDFTLRFIKSNLKDFMKSDGYGELQESHVHLIVDAFKAMSI